MPDMEEVKARREWREGEGMKEVILGSLVEDKISKLKGIAYARCIYLTGCDHIGIQPQADISKGTVPPIKWIDEPMIRVLNLPEEEKPEEEKNVKPKKKYLDFHITGGGPNEHPQIKSGPQDSDY